MIPREQPSLLAVLLSYLLIAIIAIISFVFIIVASPYIAVSTAADYVKYRKTTKEDE